MVGPQDGGFGFDQSKKYSKVENLEKVCVQCQAGQHKKCLGKSNQQSSCDCEYCIIYGQLVMKCQNIEIGCYHEKDIHEDGNGSCLIQGCKCIKYKK